MNILKMFAWISLVLASSAFAAQQGTLLVLNKSDGTVSLLDMESGQETATVPTGSGPHEVAVSPDGRLAVVTDYGAGAAGNTLTVIDIATAAALRTIDLANHRRPHGIQWLQGRQVAVTTERSRSLLIVDIEAGEILDTIGTDQDVSHMVVVSPRLQRAFIANIRSGSVTVVDLDKRRRIANIATGAGAEGIALSPDEREVWVTNREVNTVSIIDAASLEVQATLSSSEFPIRAKFTPDGRHVLVSNARSGDVAVFDATTRKEVRRIPMRIDPRELKDGRTLGQKFNQSPAPVGILIVPALNRAFVANTNADIVSVIDLATWQIVDRLTAGREPDGLGYSPLVRR